MSDRTGVALAIGGIGWGAVFALLVAGATTGSAAVTVAAGVLGILLVAVTCVVAVRMLTALRTSVRRLATRGTHGEELAGHLQGRLDEQGSSWVDLQRRHDDLASAVSVLEERAAAMQAAMQVAHGELRESEERLRIELDAARTRDEEMEVGLSRIGEGQREIGAEAAALRSAHEKSVRRIERLRRDMRTMRERVPQGYLGTVETRLDDLGRASGTALRAAYEASLRDGRVLGTALSPQDARSLFREYLRRDELLLLRPLIDGFDVLADQSLTTLRAVYRSLRSVGYWDTAERVAVVIHEKSGRVNDSEALEKIRREISVLGRPDQVTPALPAAQPHDHSGPIIHMVGNVLPQTQSGYTLRTHYTATAQLHAGMRVAVVGQSGVSGEVVEAIEHYAHGDVDYYLLPGGRRGEMLLDEWLETNIRGLAELVRDLRPSILHAHSDLFNAAIVHAVGQAYGIPTVYETRGFWEESWLSRTITAQGWGEDAQERFAQLGLPAAYTLRRDGEAIARTLPDHVLTLADVMREHILDVADKSITRSGVSLVPNAVDPAAFPVQGRDAALAAEIGLPEDALVIGYISSMVEYEGIDTLIDGFRIAAEVTDQPVHLLLVGDGAHLPVLRRQVASAGIADVHFTGRVPHEDILRYYGLIDLFVVPRKASSVSDLVTPLKPFEAFSTGRPVILSDVGALREIADQSSAVATFRAGDPMDLSRVLLELIEDPERRVDLGERASRWVRNHRTWERNALVYDRVYRELGYEGERSRYLVCESRLHERGIVPGELLDQIRDLSLPELTGWFALDEEPHSAQDILTTGWAHADFEPVLVADRPDWASYGARSRTWGFRLHTWRFLEPLLAEHSGSGERRWLDAAVDIALDWIGTYLAPQPPDDPMAWYDMSLSLRSPMLLQLLIRTAQHEDLRRPSTILLEALLQHVDRLHEDEAFTASNNHGFYAAASQLHLALHCSPLPGAEELKAEGRERLRIMIDRQFADDGTHLEHSPDYHRMLLGSFEHALHDGLVDDDVLRERIRSAAEALGWMIQPDGHLVPFGDTPSRQMIREDADSVDDTTLFILTDGRRGTAPSSELKVYPQGGYAFVRSPAPRGPGELADSGYLAFSAGFHSRAHKHADDLNLVWYDRGCEILVDAGRFGYGDLLPPDSPLREKGFYYDSAERQYVESTRAHNTLEMDGTDQDRRHRTPYGSGLQEARERRGVFDLSGRVHHTDSIHRRRVLYTPGRQLEIRDAIFSQTPEPRRAVVWFNLDGAFDLLDVGESLVFERPGAKGALRLEVTGQGELVEPVRGQEHPLRGWRSRHDRSLEPVWSFGFAVTVDVRASLETTLRLD